jgi:hypothetical protein
LSLCPAASNKQWRRIEPTTLKKKTRRSYVAVCIRKLHAHGDPKRRQKQKQKKRDIFIFLDRKDTATWRRDQSTGMKQTNKTKQNDRLIIYSPDEITPSKK